MSFKQFVEGSVSVVVNDVILPLLFGAALISFLWGVVKYFFIHSDSDESRREGRSFILWGVLGMVLLFSVWGVVYILLDIAGIAPA